MPAGAIIRYLALIVLGALGSVLVGQAVELAIARP